jgi:hypothetical protein
MPTVHSKAFVGAVSSSCHLHAKKHDNADILKELGIPTKCQHCHQSCDVCMLSCQCERCVWVRRMEPQRSDAARIAIVQSKTKLVRQDAKKRKKIIYGELKNCITNVTKKGVYKKAFFVGESQDRVFCCKKSFDSTYGINHTYVDLLVQYMKKKVCLYFYFIT